MTTDDYDELKAPEEQAAVSVSSVGELQELIEEMLVAIEEAKAVPMTGNVMVDREQMLSMLQNLKDRLPEELRAARWMIREREAFVARTNERARGIVDKAKRKGAELVSESNIIAEAVEEANTLVRRAEGDARRIRLEAEDFAAERLEYLEKLFGKFGEQTRTARAAFHQSRPPEPPVPGV